MPRKHSPFVERICQTCGKSFVVTESHLRFHPAKYCSVKCRSYKGGRYTDNQGYIRVFDPNRRRAVMEHRIIMEQHLGRDLRPDEHIHHIDENHANNDIANLQLIHPSDHARLHSTLEFGIWSRAGHRACVFCGTTKRKHSGKGLCTRCHRRYTDRLSKGLPNLFMEPEKIKANAKLTADQVREIRDLSEQGVTNKTIAQRFGVNSPETIRMIVRRLTWKDVA